MSFYEKYPKFDWKFYINIYPDLRKAGINNEKKAINHYLNYGINENRRTYEIINKEIINYQICNKVLFDNFTNISNQLYVSNGLKMFEQRFLKKYDLKNYHNIDNPAIFFGVYSNTDLNKLNNHKGLKIIIWGGEDCNCSNEHSKQTLNEEKFILNCIHLSISESIFKSLKSSNISSIIIDFNLVDNNIFYPIPKNELGNKIFIFNGQSKGREIIYGEIFYKEVVSKLTNYEFIYSNNLNIKWEEMPNIYKQCFIVLRLTQHDGNANSVQECQSMNIPVVHNHSDYGLKWKTVNDIINFIEKYSNK